MLLPTLARIDWVINNPSKGGLDIDYSKPLSYERWSWCDALFMAPGVYTRLYTLTGNKKYMIFSDAEFKATYNHLYDKEEHLFFRDSRYFNQKEAGTRQRLGDRRTGRNTENTAGERHRIPPFLPTTVLRTERTPGRTSKQRRLLACQPFRPRQLPLS